jgi:hypothetical protein
VELVWIVAGIIVTVLQYNPLLPVWFGLAAIVVGLLSYIAEDSLTIQ